MKKLLSIILMGAGVLTMTACSTTNPGGADMAYGNASGDAGVNGAVVSGAGDADNFGANANKMQIGNQKYYFDFDKYDLRADDLPSIKVQSDYLATHEHAHVLLAGNTDERGSREYNIALGNKRAQSVAQQLRAGGVKSNQINTVSYGAEKPVATGHDESSWMQNRRVDLNYETAVTTDSQ